MNRQNERNKQQFLGPRQQQSCEIVMPTKKNFMVSGFYLLMLSIFGCSGQFSSFNLSQGLDIFKKGVVERPSFTDADEERMAQEDARHFEAKHPILDDPLLDAYLTEITQRIVALTKSRPFSYRVRVVKAPDVNAFTFGGGVLYVNAGLLARMENEAQLAMVLSHEIAHITEGHVPKGIEATFGIQLLGEIAATAASSSGSKKLSGEALQKTYDYSMNASINGHGRSQESEADEIGLEYMVKAGYDPIEAPKMIEQIMKEYGDQQPVKNFFYGDHPTNVTRIKRLTEFVNTRYSGLATKRTPVVNTPEFKRRTREIVVVTGILDYKMKRFNTAAVMFEKAVKTNSKDQISHYYLGKIVLETSSSADAVDRAIGHLISSTKADPRYAPAYREMGSAYYRKGNNAKAIAAFERYLFLDPSAEDAARIKSSIKDLKNK